VNDFLKAVEAAKYQISYRGMMVGSGAWDQILDNAHLVKPAPHGLMEFCGFKVMVNEELPDHIIVWTDDRGKPLHIQSLRKDEAT